MWTVYKHTNSENGKVYIGITSQPVERRWRTDGSGYKKCLLFYKAIQKYGWENFKHEILYFGLAQEEAEQIEQKLISTYRSNQAEFGYNIANGGRTHNISDQTKIKISNTLKANYIKEQHPNYGKRFGCEMRKKLSDAHVGLQSKEKHPLYGKCQSEEIKNRIRQTNISKGIAPSMEARKKGAEARSKPVIQFDSKWNKIQEFSSITLAAKETGANKCMIGKSCKSNGEKIVSNSRWKFAETKTR